MPIDNDYFKNRQNNKKTLHLMNKYDIITRLIGSVLWKKLEI